MFLGALVLPREEETSIPEAQSPFAPTNVQQRSIGGYAGGTGSPIPTHRYTTSGNLYVVNPSDTTRDSPAILFENSKTYEKYATTSKYGITTTIRPLGNLVAGSSSFGRDNDATDQMVMGNSMRSIAISNQAKVLQASKSKPEKKLFGKSRGAKQDLRGMISNPIMTETDPSSKQPFARMPTIDLAAAARADQERRQARHRVLVAQRPAPPPPNILPSESLRRATSTNRKEVRSTYTHAATPSTSSGSTILSSKSSSGLSAQANASSTSTELSPAREEMRRRSPRSADVFQNADEKPRRIAPNLQRKGTLGLPSNPRTNNMLPKRPVVGPKEQTVMFINEIVYDDPDMVKHIMDGVSQVASKVHHGDDSTSLEATAPSIIHRPRPYRRDSEHDRGIWPSAPSPHHRRSKSAGSVKSRRTLLQQSPESLPQLPPVPVSLRSAASLPRLKQSLLDNSKSMTFDEKFELLFPAPPGMTIRSRRSSVPSIPCIPIGDFSPTLPPQSPTEEETAERRVSKRTTIASYGIQALSQSDTIAPEVCDSAGRYVHRFSANTYRDLADPSNELWPSEVPELALGFENASTRASISKANYEHKSTISQATTAWASLHSPTPPVNVTQARQNARSTVIQARAQAGKQESPELTLLQSQEDDHQIMTITLEDEGSRQSFKLLDTRPDVTQIPLGPNGQWHRRIGDILPFFSDRRNTRAMPPPAPLLLNSAGRPTATLTRAPSPPEIDSPAAAIQEIQAQLRRIEESGRGSVGSLLRLFPETGSNLNNSAIGKENEGLRLLETLEMEMGQQQNQWQQMQHNFLRDSISTCLSPSVASEGAGSRVVSQRYSYVASRPSDAQQVFVGNDISMRIKSDESNLTTSTTQSSENSRASAWQQRLAEAHGEYLDHVPVLLQNRNINFLAMPNMQIGSPTPPDSLKSGTDDDFETQGPSSAASGEVRPNVWGTSNITQAQSLWQPHSWSPSVALGRLWNPQYEQDEDLESPSPPAINLRPAQRFIQRSPTITSSELWSKTTVSTKPDTGLWESKVSQPKSVVTRPVTVRPARKSKRMTFLPDISEYVANKRLYGTDIVLVESPKPLPHKHEELGLYQFPWGEKSEFPTIPPVPYPVFTQPVFIATAFDISQGFNTDNAECSSFFSDDYDEEDYEEEDYEEDYEQAEESEDDFDESTLWEIASMLKSTDVPSRNSLLPDGRHVIEDYEADEISGAFGLVEDQWDKNSSPAPRRIEKFIPIGPLKSTVPAKRLLWESTSHYRHPAAVFGLIQPAADTWNTYLESTNHIVRCRPRKATAILALATSHMWRTSDLRVASKQSVMWLMQNSREDSISNQTSTKVPAPTMWSAQPSLLSVKSTTLFDPSITRNDFRTSLQRPSGIDMIRKTRFVRSQLSTLSSDRLWMPNKDLEIEHHWVTESSVRAVSPTVSFVSSSGQSSPTSTISSIGSAESSSTKASSIWSSFGALAKKPAWWHSKSSQKSALPRAVRGPMPILENVPAPEPELSKILPSETSASLPSRIPVLEKRTSKVLESRDMFESKQALTDKVAAAPVATQVATRDLVHIIQPRVTRPLAKFPADWDTALVEAIASAGIHKVSSAERWDEALVEAIAQSKIHRYVSSADWDVALLEASISGTPASSTTKNTITMWASAHSVHVSRSGSGSAMWTPPVHLRHSPSLFESLDTKSARRVNPPQTIALLALDSAELWKPALTDFASTRHWLEIAKSSNNVRTAARTWIFPKQEPEAHRESSLWEPTSKAAATADIFAPVHNQPIRKERLVRTIALAELTSKAFWTPKRVESVARHWLMVSRSSVVLQSNAQTWTPRDATPIPEEWKMWTPSPRVVAIRDLFETTQVEHPRKIYIPRTSALAELTSTKLWAPKAVEPSARHWLKSFKSDPCGPFNAQIWSAPKPIVVAYHEKSMWSPSPQAVPSLERFAISNTENLRKQRFTPTLPLASITSTELWKAKKVEASARHWLHTSRKENTGSRSRMWAAVVAANTDNNQAPKGMWTPVTKGLACLDLFATSSFEHVRKQRATDMVTLTRLTSTALWLPREVDNPVRDWLHTSSTLIHAKPAIILVAPVVEEEQPAKTMWIRPVVKPQPVELFEAYSGGPFRKARKPSTTPLATLQSTTTWTPPYVRTVNVRNWLHHCSALASVPASAQTPALPVLAPISVASAQTWTNKFQPSTLQSTEDCLWSNVRRPVHRQQLFANPHTEPRIRNARNVADVMIMERFLGEKLWCTVKAVPEGPKDWLVRRHFSKVQFRY